MAFTQATLQFLHELELNNDRDWFQARKQDYEEVVRSPMTAFVQAINSELSTSGVDYVTEPQHAIYRIYRDTRFSADKTPYKTHISALFPHRQLGKSGGAALYFHLSGKELLVAGGLYKCPGPILIGVRRHIAADHERLSKMLGTPQVRRLFGGLQGEQLKRAPKGWPPHHPAIGYLRYKDLLLEVSLPPAEGLGPAAYKTVATRFRAIVPFVSFLNEPLLAERKRQRQDPLMAF
jgi:uncharacterized protein (TIGR02453 family)